MDKEPAAETGSFPLYVLSQPEQINSILHALSLINTSFLCFLDDFQHKPQETEVQTRQDDQICFISTEHQFLHSFWETSSAEKHPNVGCLHATPKQKRQMIHLFL